MQWEPSRESSIFYRPLFGFHNLTAHYCLGANRLRRQEQFDLNQQERRCRYQNRLYPK